MCRSCFMFLLESWLFAMVFFFLNLRICYEIIIQKLTSDDNVMQFVCLFLQFRTSLYFVCIQHVICFVNQFSLYSTKIKSIQNYVTWVASSGNMSYTLWHVWAGDICVNKQLLFSLIRTYLFTYLKPIINIILYY